MRGLGDVILQRVCVVAPRGNIISAWLPVSYCVHRMAEICVQLGYDDQHQLVEIAVQFMRVTLDDSIYKKTCDAKLELYKADMYLCEGLDIGKFDMKEATPQKVLLNMFARLS